MIHVTVPKVRSACVQLSPPMYMHVLPKVYFLMTGEMLLVVRFHFDLHEPYSGNFISNNRSLCW